MASPNPNQPSATPAYDEDALKSFYALCRSYSEIKTYESARAMFFEDYDEYKTEIQAVWPEINEASVCEVYLGPLISRKGSLMKIKINSVLAHILIMTLLNLRRLVF